MRRFVLKLLTLTVLPALIISLSGCGPDSESGSQSTGDSIAAAAPQTEILIASVNTSNGVSIGDLSSVTRGPGYDNQPAFTPDGDTLFWTSIRGGQADIYRRSLAEKSDSTVRLTKTPQSEYSPTFRPDGGLSIVRVENDGRQRLWHYSVAGEPVEPLFPEADSIGYHAWLDSDRVALFVLGSPPTLHVKNLTTGQDTVVASGIGRSLRSIPGRSAVSYIRVRDDSTTTIHVLTGEEPLETRRLTATPGSGQEDFHAWTPDSTLLMTDDGVVWAWSAAEEEWNSVASFEGRTFTRLDVSPNGTQLALVEEK